MKDSRSTEIGQCVMVVVVHFLPPGSQAFCAARAANVANVADRCSGSDQVSRGHVRVVRLHPESTWRRVQRQGVLSAFKRVGERGTDPIGFLVNEEVG